MNQPDIVLRLGAPLARACGVCPLMCVGTGLRCGIGRNDVGSSPVVGVSSLLSRMREQIEDP